VFSRQRSQIELRDLPPLIAAAVLSLIPLIAAGGILAALPVLLLIVPLMFGCFPGESVIERLAASRRPGRRRERRAEIAPPTWVSAPTLLRSRLLIAASFAERPPPVPLPAS
jgi:hypothetical protein